ncbi:MAG: hypothetical protein ACFFAZ_00300 [Promethearchaeota archaeon]
MASLIVIALAIPIITIVQIIPETIDLQLNYLYRHSVQHGSFDSDTGTNYTIYEFSSAATLDNFSLVLSGKEVRSYPVWINVSSWDFGDTVQIANQTVTIEWDSERNGLECWIGQLQNGTDVYYSKEYGVFLGTYYHEFEFIGATFYSETYQIELTYQNLMDFFEIEYEFNIDALVLSIVLIEAAIVIWLVERGRR